MYKYDEILWFDQIMLLHEMQNFIEKLLFKIGKMVDLIGEYLCGMNMIMDGEYIWHNLETEDH